MFYGKTCIKKKFRYNIVAIEKESKKQIITLLL